MSLSASFFRNQVEGKDEGCSIARVSPDPDRVVGSDRGNRRHRQHDRSNQPDDRTRSESIGSGVTASSGRPGEEVTDSGWSRVRKLEPGTEVIITITGSQPGRRYVLWADESGVSVVNLSSPALPPRAASALRKAASNHPLYFTDALQIGPLALDRNVRLDSGAVFVDGAKVATLEQVVERITRPQVVEVRSPSRDYSVKKRVGIGIATGLGVGLLLGRLNEYPGGCDDPGLATEIGAAWGLGLGAAAGLLIGSMNAAKHDTAIYRAP